VTLPFLAAIGALALLTILPGADFAVVLRWAAVGGARIGITTALGVVAGCAVWGALAVLGLAALFTAFPPAFEVMRILGAGYLVWMAARLIGKSLLRESGFDTRFALLNRRHGLAFRQGLFTNLLNPKIAAFYVGVLPALVPAGAPPAITMAALVACHIILGLIWLSLVSLAVARGRSVLGRPAVRRWLDRITGVVLLGFRGAARARVAPHHPFALFARVCAGKPRRGGQIRDWG
jgi:threonine/homoserine/homoserine lactone efflux protein